MVTAGNNGSGRIHPHQRNANFTGTIIGDHIELDAQHVERVQLTEQHYHRMKRVTTAMVSTCWLFVFVIN